MNTFQQLDSQEFEDLQKVGERVELLPKQQRNERERGRTVGCSPRGSRGSAQVHRSTAAEDGRRRRSPARRKSPAVAKRRELGGREKN
jgi:hypothetical protein